MPRADQRRPRFARHHIPGNGPRQAAERVRGPIFVHETPEATMILRHVSIWRSDFVSFEQVSGCW